VFLKVASQVKNKMKVKLPSVLKEQPLTDRVAFVESIAKSLSVPTRMVLQDEHNVWERSPEPIIGDLEDAFYTSLTEPMWATMHDVFDALGLPMVDPSTTQVESIQKAFGDGFYDWIEKAQKPSISDLINQAKAARDAVSRTIAGVKRIGEPLIKRIESILKRHVPDYERIATEMAAKAVRAGRAINEAELYGLTVARTLVEANKPVPAAHLLPISFDLVSYRVPMSDGKGVQVIQPIPTTPQEVDAMHFAKHHAGSRIALQDTKFKEGVKTLVMRAVHERWTSQELAARLFSTFGEYNRDWRRIALTELSEALSNGYLAGLNEGDRVEGISAVNACRHCQQKINGKVYEYSKVPRWDEPDKYVWIGKSNFGRKVAQYVACVPLHPSCRCRWQRMSAFYEMKDGKMTLRSVDDLYEAYKRGELKP
jgi:hypothetical protein